MRLVDPGEAWDRELGVEPLSTGFTHEAFIGMLSGRTTPVKALLLDQRRIAGIGNIYACEALWEARIRPSRPARSLSKPAICRLRRAIVEILQRAVDLRGTSVDDYVDADGLQGGFQNNLSVYGRDGRPCPRCGARIVRTVLSQTRDVVVQTLSTIKNYESGKVTSLQLKSLRFTMKKIN